MNKSCCANWDAPTSNETLNRLLKKVKEVTSFNWEITEECVVIRRLFTHDEVGREFTLRRNGRIVNFYRICDSHAHGAELIAAYLYGVIIGATSCEEIKDV